MFILLSSAHAQTTTCPSLAILQWTEEWFIHLLIGHNYIIISGSEKLFTFTTKAQSAENPPH